MTEEQEDRGSYIPEIYSYMYTLIKAVRGLRLMPYYAAARGLGSSLSFSLRGRRERGAPGPGPAVREIGIRIRLWLCFTCTLAFLAPAAVPASWFRGRALLASLLNQRSKPQDVLVADRASHQSILVRSFVLPANP